MKMIVISKTDDRYWGSCDEIELAFDGVIDQLRSKVTIEHIKYTEDVLDQKIIEIMNLIDKGYDSIYFLSHNINFNTFLKKLSNYRDVLNLLIPVYGDMTIQVNRWTDAHHNLKGWKTKIIVASIASKKQIEKFVQNKKSIYILKHSLTNPYLKPVKEKEDTGITKYIYAGRISLGKNVFALMDDFITASKIKNNIELNIYGSVDSIGYRFINYSRIDHILLEEFNHILKLSGGVIKYHGQKSSKEMSSIYKDHDYFISMSTYQDEDYGLAVAQSIASNCYPILSKWGGYRDFDCATHIETKLMSNFHFTYNRKRLIQTICNPPPINKEEMLEYSIQNIYPDAIAINLFNILEKESEVYSGQTSFFWKYRNFYKKNSGQPYINIKNSLEVESVYKSVYHSYYE